MKNQGFFFSAIMLVMALLGGILTSANPTAFTLFLLATCAGLLLHLSVINIRLRRLRQ